MISSANASHNIGLHISDASLRDFGVIPLNLPFFSKYLNFLFIFFIIIWLYFRKIKLSRLNEIFHYFQYTRMINIWDKVFKNGPSKICGKQPLKNLKGYGLLGQTISLQFFKRLSSTNFTWSILECFVPFISDNINRIRVFTNLRHLRSFHI